MRLCSRRILAPEGGGIIERIRTNPSIRSKTLLESLLLHEARSLPQNIGRENLLPSRSLLIIAIVSAAAIGGGILTFAIGIPSSPCSGTAGTTRNFTIIADINGYNDSKVYYQQGQSWPTIQWPVIGVSRCDMVVIKIINQDTQTHGFAISYYANKGSEIPGGQTLTVQFLASKTGQFKIYCIVPCTAHTYMLYGTLNVS